MRNSPNFLVIGAEKSGTTWLYNKLREHPEIYLPMTKECHFFNQYNSNLQLNSNYTELGWEWYRRFFENVPKTVKAQGEVTPMYLCDPKAPQRIAQDLPDVKLIYILRNPVTRAYSHYWMAYRKGHTNKSFKEIVADKDTRFIRRGNYAQQLQRYYDIFPRENLRGYIYERFFETPFKHLADIHSFLSVKIQRFSEEKQSKKILASPKPKSIILHNTISKVAKTLRRNALTFGLLDKVKEKGIASKIKAWNTDSKSYPPMEESIYYELLDYYLIDIAKIESKYDLNFNYWKKNINR